MADSGLANDLKSHLSYFRKSSWAGYHWPVILAFDRWRQEDQECKAILSWMRLLKKKKKTLISTLYVVINIDDLQIAA